MINWDQRFLGLARHVAGWSKDPSTQVGAVIVDDQNRVMSVGFNGFPRGVEDDGRLDDRKTKYELIVHAEINALMFANRNLSGCALYVWPLSPCSRCAAQIIQSGITKVIAPVPNFESSWIDSVKLAAAMFEEAGVKLLWSPIPVGDE